MKQLLQNIIQLFKQVKTGTVFKDKTYATKIQGIDFSHLYNPDNHFTDEFYSNLLRTINWTEKIISNIENKSQINFSTVLRFTNPNYQGKPFYRYDGTTFSFAATPEISFNCLPVLNEALSVRGESKLAITDINQFGQILEFEIDLTTHDGAPCAASEGFVDESDIPPIDTWFYLTRTKLYCWIPKLFIENMQAAIDVEIFDSYRWIKDSNPHLQMVTIKKLNMQYNGPFGNITA